MALDFVMGVDTSAAIAVVLLVARWLPTVFPEDRARVNDRRKRDDRDAARPYGVITTLMQSSSFRLKVSYISGPSSSET